MKVKIKTAGVEAGKRLDLKKADSWSLWDGDTLLEEKMPIPDAGLGLDHYKCIANNDSTVSVVRFADLHRHSDNSLRDGILKVPDMVKHTEYAGALTDHGNLYGFVEYYNAMKAAGKKPIIGMEAYQENLRGELSRNHLILLAKNDVGYKNLIKLSSESFEHFYHKPHVTWEMLKQYHEGIICTTACLGGLIPKSFANGDRESAYYAAKQLLKIFGEDFYIEIQRHGIKDEELVNPQLLGLARELNIPIVATTDSHYLRKEDAYAHEVMMCLEQDVTIDMPHRRYEGTGYHLHSSEEMEKLFGDLPEALDNTLRIADKCNVTVKMGDVNLPNYEIPAPFATPLEYFKHICKTGFDERFQGKPEHEDPVYLERYNYEMSVIEKMGFETYFLIVWDFINYARSVNVYIGPGRGSAAGSLLAFCMGITDMDPIRFNLLFERFLNPERVSWPDIDTDIEHVGRQKVIDYITKKYGAESVCRIVTFGTMAAKMVIKDVARVMGYPPAWANNLAKLVPNAPKITLASAFEMNPELRRRYSEEPDVARVIDVAKTLEGCKRHASQHACFEAGTLITTKDGLKKIEDIQCGDEVLTHLGRFKPVVDTIVTQTNNVYQVGFYGSPSISVTGNHPLYVRHQSSVKTRTNNGSKTRKRVYDAPIWKPVADIVDDDYVAIPINQTEELPRLEGLPYKNPDFWWVIGRYIGDGWTEQYHRPEISAGRFERRIIICCGKQNTSKTVTDITEKLESCGFAYRVEECRTTYKVFINSLDPLYDYLDTFGHYAHGKHLTGDILNLPILYAESFLDGYMSADGSFSKAQSIYSMKTVSKPLALGFIQLVNKVFHKAAGLSVRPMRQDVIEGRTVQSKEKYQITFTKNNRPMQKSFYEDGFIWVRAKSVSVEAKKKPMYNLTVLDDSSYQANGIAAHNCGLVVAPGKVENFLPTSMEKGEGGEKSLTSQVVMTEVELLSLLKMDLLGLKNLSAIHEVMDTVKRTRGIDMKYQDLPLDDRDTYKMLSKGLTGGVFQLESAGMTDVIRQMLGDINALPDERMGECFERLIAAVALYRPGPMDYIPDYIKGMMDSSSIHYDCKQEKDILASTYGVMVYQEQLMHIAQTLAGYSLGEADLLRKACGKKKKDVMAKEHARFVYGNKEDFDVGKAKHLIPGCVGNGISPDVAEEIWNKMEKFASYAFNRSHAACYAWIASITAYMACHWPAEFFCAMLNAFEDISDKVKNYLAIAARRGIKLLPPDINKSMDKCTVEGDCIRLGFHALSGLNKLSRAIAQVRRTGEFKSYQEFYERMSTSEKLNKKALESLVNSGALDCFGMNRRQMTEMIPKLEKNFKSEAKDRALNQISLFSEEQRRIQPPEVPEYDEKILMEKELNAIGFYLSKHPVNATLAKVKNPGSYIPISDLAVLETPQRQVMTLGLISDVKLIYTRKEEEMYLFSLEDQFNSIRCVLFPSRVAANKHRLTEGAVVKAVGEFAVDEDHGKQIIVNDLMGEDEILAEKSNSVTVTIRNKVEQERLLAFVKKNPGNSGVVLLANGKPYPITPKIRVTPETLDYLRSNFSHISA